MDLKKNTDDATALKIASDSSRCWFCGSRSTHIKEYKYTREEDLGSKKAVYTKTIPVNLCDVCDHELEERGKWDTAAICLMGVVLSAAFLYIFDFWTEFKFFGWALTVVGVFFASVILCVILNLGTLLRKVLDRNNMMPLDRDLDEHPAVKQALSEGYRKSN